MESAEYYQEQLKRQEKLASLGLLSAGIAHEVQNPLNFVINFGKMSQKLVRDIIEIIDDNKDKLSSDDVDDLDAAADDLQSNLEKILSHSERAVNIVRDILLMSRGKENEFLPTDVSRIVKEYVWLSYHSMRANFKNFNISIKEQYEAGAPLIKVIPQDLSRAVLNVMNNACYAVWQRQQKDGKDFSPEISVCVKFEDGSVVITIADNGDGMTDEVKQKLYENFFTTKPAGQGTGLGMAITRDIIENKHKGKISFESELGKGTSFRFEIPAEK
ncbi:MAG: HAMP domain-containing histidine kinase [Bacteroidales bacterium]|jgi:signal transduction histidine kinase|nr:HAMP domain-containing histidine kinase [Bacteroidales bacterium]